RTSDLHRVGGDADERNETRTGCLPAVGAETIAHEARLPPGFIAHCATQTSTCPGPIAHAATIGPESSLGKFAAGRPRLSASGATRESAAPRRPARRRTLNSYGSLMTVSTPRTQPCLSYILIQLAFGVMASADHSCAGTGRNWKRAKEASHQSGPSRP